MSPLPVQLTVPERKALFRTLLCLALLGAGGMFLGFHNPFMQIPPLALLAPASMCLMARLSRSNWGAFHAGWLSCALGQAAGLYWLAVPMHDFGGLPWVIAALCVIALGGYLGLYGGLFCLVYRIFHRRIHPLAGCLLAGLAWGGLELARGWLFTGFPWVSLSSAFVPWPIWIQAAAVLGAYGLSAAYAAIAAALTEAAPLRFIPSYTAVPVQRRQRLLALCLAAAILAPVYWYGLRALRSTLPAGTPFRAGLVQGNVNQDQKWEPRYQQQTVTRYLTLSERAVNPALGAVTAPVDLLIWPETSMPFYFEENQNLASQITAFAERFRVPIAFGAPGKGVLPDGNASYHNRLWFHTPEPFGLQSYDKTHLVPFGEYVPLNIPLPFIDYFLQGIDFSPGQAGALLRLGTHKIGVLICYEAIFPELARQQTVAGANILINISNDAWFGRTAAPMQHLQLTSMRAVETGRYILRATNTGYSAAIDPRGRITARGTLFRAEVVIAEGAFMTGTTLFVSLMPYINAALVLLPILALWLCFASRKKDGAA